MARSRRVWASARSWSCRMMSSRPAATESGERSEPARVRPRGVMTPRVAQWHSSAARAADLRARSRSACRSGGQVAMTAPCARAFGSQLAVEHERVVGRGEGFGFVAAHGVEDGLARAAIVGQKTGRVVAVGPRVPGVGRELPAALRDVTGVPVEGRRGEEMDLTPGAALRAVNGAGPCVRDVRGAVCPVPSDDVGVDLDVRPVVGHHVEAVAGDAEHGGGRAVAHVPVRTGGEVGVHEDPVARGVGPRVGSPSWSSEGRASQFATLRRGSRVCDPRGLRSRRGLRPAPRRVRRRDDRRPQPRPRPAPRGYRSSWRVRVPSRARRG